MLGLICQRQPSHMPSLHVPPTEVLAQAARFRGQHDSKDFVYASILKLSCAVILQAMHCNVPYMNMYVLVMYRYTSEMCVQRRGQVLLRIVLH